MIEGTFQTFDDWARGFPDRMDKKFDLIVNPKPAVLEAIWNLDTSADKALLPHIERWMAHFYRQWDIRSLKDFNGILEEAGLPEAIKHYQEDPSLIYDGILDTLQAAKTTLLPRRRRMQTSAPSPLDRAGVNGFVAQIKQQKQRKDRRDPTYVKLRDEKFIGSGEAELLHEAPTFRIYHLKTAAACKTYFNPETYSRDAFAIETETGAIFKYELPTTYMTDERERPYSYKQIETLFPGFFEIVKPTLIKELAKVEPGDRNYFLTSIASTRRYFSIWSDLAKAEDVAAYFKNLYLGAPKSERWAYTDSVKILQTMSLFPNAAQQLSGEDVRTVFNHIVRLRQWGAAQEYLARAVTVKEWRDAITAEDIAPVFDGLSRARSYGAREMCMAYMFVLGAQHPKWLTGNEAKYLPATLKYLSKDHMLFFKRARYRTADPDWPKVKILLRRAESYAPWRAQITPDLLSDIEPNPSDNRVKTLCLPQLWARFTAAFRNDSTPRAPLAELTP